MLPLPLTTPVPVGWCPADAIPPPPTWAGECTLGQPPQEMLEGGPHTEVGAKPQLSLRGCARRAERSCSCRNQRFTPLRLALWSQCLGNIQMGDGSGFSRCGLCEQVHIGIGPGQNLSFLRNSHSGSRCMIAAVQGPDFSESVQVAWWKQCLRDIRANCQHTHG